MSSTPLGLSKLVAQPFIVLLGILSMEVTNGSADHLAVAPTTLPGSILVQQYDAGATAVLHCASNDDYHNFMYWQLASNRDLVVGPQNEYDHKKYKFDVLTGQLFIKNVSPQETGIYKCISRGVTDNNLNIQTVELVVEKEWEDVYENDTDINLLRALTGSTVIILILGVIFVVLKMKRRIPHTHLGREGRMLIGHSDSSEDEESAEELFTTPKASTSRTGNIVLNQASSSGLRGGGADNPGIETDFRAVYATLNSEND